MNSSPNLRRLAALKAKSLHRRLRTIDSVDGIRVQRDGRVFVNFASNDYLGLAQHPALRAAAIEAVKEFGAGSGASRLITGTLAVHQELEAKLAVFKQTTAALTFESGYAAATGTIPALFGKGDIIILDKLVHACLIDGARLSGAEIRVYPHNRLDRLEELLKWARQKRPGSNILVLTESVFSMDGDLCPLSEIVELKEKYGAILLLDEAHATGVCGPGGAGLAAELGLGNRIEIQMGTLSKAVGSAGGFVAGDAALIDLLINSARTFIYSTAPTPAAVAAAIAGVSLISSPTGEQLRATLRDNVKRCRENQELTGSCGSAIVPIVVGSESEALRASEKLAEQGYLVPAIRFPTVPRNSARLRVTLSAAHEPKEILGLREAIAGAATEPIRLGLHRPDA
ncbi:MAG: 8-amino-7-oxononanoate synthase [Verrucomicrobia bacterium]|nr:8-amino-7-oxononanoate synthase [Verrucomicrobiota bacterium]